MKKTYMKSLLVACVATLTSMGLHSGTVEAITENRVIKEKNLWDKGQQEAITLDVRVDEYNRLLEEKVKAAEAAEAKLEAAVETSVPAAATAKAEVKAPEKKQEEPAVDISSAEKDLFARLVEAEAKGESFEGKVAVATVVLNRVDSPQFPDTITGVIKEVVGGTYAFSPVQNGEINKPASEEAVQAVEEALTSENRLNGSVYFYNPEIAEDEWILSRPVVKTIGNHVFAK